jgi:hypothetical protein
MVIHFFTSIPFKGAPELFQRFSLSGEELLKALIVASFAAHLPAKDAAGSEQGLDRRGQPSFGQSN